MSQSEAPLVFVYLGDMPPKYMRAALTLARQFSNVPVKVVAPAAFSSAVPLGCDHIKTELFYDKSTASDMLSGLRPSSSQHLDLWVHSAERFVVLNSYAEWAGLRTFFHAELDCIPFRLDVLRVALEATELSGMFLPFDRPDRAVASLVFVNNRAALSHFVTWSAGVHYRNEMEQLARFAQEHPEAIVGLPTLEVLQAPQRFEATGLRMIDPLAMGCMVDAASLGQYVSGVDPMHLRILQLHRNHFVNENVPDAEMLRGARFTWDDFVPVITYPDGRSLWIHGLHLHSKVHKHLIRRRALARLLRRANCRRSRLVPGAIGHAARSVTRRCRLHVRRAGRLLAIRIGDCGLIRRTGMIRMVSRPEPLRRHQLLRVLFERALPVDPLAGSSDDRLPAIEVMVPCAEKDLAQLELVVDSVALGVANPVQRVVIVTPSSAQLRVTGLLGDRASVVTDEHLVLPRTSAAIAELVPPGRRNWVKQQVLKLGFVASSEAEGVLVLDADTILLKPRVWLRDGRQILSVAHEYHAPYVNHTKRVLGPTARDEGLSWVTHHQLMQPQIVREMMRQILCPRLRDSPSGDSDIELDLDRALEVWVRSADFSETSALSEYHTYGVFLRSAKPNMAVAARWGNATVRPSQLPSGVQELRWEFPDTLSISAHSYFEVE